MENKGEADMISTGEIVLDPYKSTNGNSDTGGWGAGGGDNGGWGAGGGGWGGGGDDFGMGGGLTNRFADLDEEYKCGITISSSDDSDDDSDDGKKMQTDDASGTDGPQGKFLFE